MFDHLGQSILRLSDRGRRIEISEAATGVHARFKRSAVDFRQRGVQDRNVTGQFLFLPLRIGGYNVDADLVRFNFYILTLRAHCVRQRMNGVVAGAFEPDPLVQIDIQDDGFVAKATPARARIGDAFVKTITPGVAGACFGCDDETITPEAQNGAVMPA